MSHVEVLTADGARAEHDALCELLIDCVNGGASVGFLAPLSPATAHAFWRRVADWVAQGARRLLVARDAAGRIAGSVQLVLDLPENQPHRADLAKLLVHQRMRRQGVGEALMIAAETVARDAGRTLLVLDTATPEAARLYQRTGWQLCGRIPNYALYPDGTLCATTVFYKALAAPDRSA
jgi:GNAT superfamily N-acetyltransferase